MTVPFSDFPLVPHGHRFEDFEIGRAFEHHWGRTVTEADNVAFTTSTCNWMPMYLDVEYARRHGHRSTVVSPMLVLCIVVGLSVEDLSEIGGPFLGIERCEFLVDVYPGDTLNARSVVMSRRESESRPGRGIVTWETEGFRQDGDVVVRFLRSNLVAKARP